MIRTLNGSIERLSNEEREQYGHGYKYKVTDEYKYWEGVLEEIERFADSETSSDESSDPYSISDAEFPPDVRHICVPKGFLSDGSSGTPDITFAWVFHDYLYATHRFTSGQECTRKEADDLMVTILKRNGHKFYGSLAAAAFYMNPFWVFSRAWNKSGARGIHLVD